MDLEMVREKALRMAFRTGRILNVQAVWDEQEAAGERRCYGAADGGCLHAGCCFRESCLHLSAEPVTTPLAQLLSRRAAS